jgi:hypothetical protein
MSLAESDAQERPFDCDVGQGGQGDGQSDGQQCLDRRLRADVVCDGWRRG